MNRRRFLKYAGATVAVVGASALGLDYTLNSKSPIVSQNVTSTTLPLNGKNGTTQIQTSSTQVQASTGPQLVFETDFSDGTLEGFGPGGVDTSSIPCTNLPLPTREDFQVSIVDDTTAPTGKNKALELITNANKRPGLSFNAIIARRADEFPVFSFIENSNYRAYGYFRRLKSDIDTMDINMNRVDKDFAYDCCFGWVLNRYARDYGMIQLRTKKSVEAARNAKTPWILGENMFNLGDDTKWHWFEIEGEYIANPKSRKIKRLVVDKKEYQLDEEMWGYNESWSDTFWVALETANEYVNCDTNMVSQGITRICKLGLIRTPVE